MAKIVKIINDIRSDTAEAWAEKNPILRKDEPGRELGPPDKLKFGDGITRWNDLPYFGVSSGSGWITEEDLLDHINHLTPHPAYDDIMSLTLLYENAKV